MLSNATENEFGVHVKTIFFWNFLSSTGEEVFYGRQQSQGGNKEVREEEEEKKNVFARQIQQSTKRGRESKDSRGGEAGYQIQGSAGLLAMSGQYPPISITEDKCKRTEVSLT